MPGLVEVALSNALMAIALAVVARLVGASTRRPALEHAMWLLVLLKLITPPGLPLVLPEVPRTQVTQVAQGAQAGDGVDPQESLPPELAVAQWMEQLSSTPLEERALVHDAPHTKTPLADDATPPPTTSPAASRPPEPPVEEASVVATRKPSGVPAGKPSATSLLLTLWGLGAFFVLIKQLRRILAFERLLSQARRGPAGLQDRAQEIARRYGLRRVPTVVLLRGNVSPMVWPLGRRPRLLMPEALLQQLQADQVDTLLAHELAHLRRGDHLTRALELLVRVLYWWHPLLWWSSARMRVLEEMACDAWVTWSHPHAQQAYASALLDTLDFLAEPRPALPPLASGLGHMTFLKRRLAMIMQGSPQRSLSLRGWALAGACGLLLLPWTPSVAREHDDEPRRVEAEVEVRDNRSHNALIKIGQLLVDGKVEEANRLAAQVRKQRTAHGEHNSRSTPWQRMRERDERREGPSADWTEWKPIHDARLNEQLQMLERQVQRGIREFQQKLIRELGGHGDEFAEAIDQSPEEAAAEFRKEIGRAIERALNRVPRQVWHRVEELDVDGMVSQSLNEVPKWVGDVWHDLDAQDTLEELFSDIGRASRLRQAETVRREAARHPDRQRALEHARRVEIEAEHAARQARREADRALEEAHEVAERSRVHARRNVEIESRLRRLEDRLEQLIAELSRRHNHDEDEEHEDGGPEDEGDDPDETDDEDFGDEDVFSGLEDEDEDESDDDEDDDPFADFGGSSEEEENEDFDDDDPFG